jgi:hypothetical protein
MYCTILTFFRRILSVPEAGESLTCEDISTLRLLAKLSIWNPDKVLLGITVRMEVPNHLTTSPRVQPTARPSPAVTIRTVVVPVAELGCDLPALTLTFPHVRVSTRGIASDLGNRVWRSQVPDE